jgi:UDP:flavonoid glycosyltransferase YjiC (YdhE family)
VQHHGCGIALKAKSRPEKIRRAVNKILTESSFRQAAGSFQKDIMQNDQSNNILREIENLMAPFNDREVAFSKERIRYA